jgi:hypothetical protein
MRTRTWGVVRAAAALQLTLELAFVFVLRVAREEVERVPWVADLTERHDADDPERNQEGGHDPGCDSEACTHVAV